LGGWLVADSELESCRTPVDERNGSLGLDCCSGGVALFRIDVSSEEESAGHVLALSRVALDHLIIWLKASESHFGDRVLFMSRFLRRDDRGVGSEWEMNSWEGYQIGLEFVEIDIESSVEGREQVMLETTWAIRRFRLVKDGEVTPRLRRQMS